MSSPVQVCDPAECAAALFRLLFLLRIVKPSENLAIAAPNTLRPNLLRLRSLVPPPRVRAGPGMPYNPAQDAPIPVPPEGWVGTRFQFGGRWYASAAEAAIGGLQALLAILPDPARAANDPEWRDYPWDRLLTSEPFPMFDGGGLTELVSQADELCAAVGNEYDATRRESAVREPKGADKPITPEEREIRNIKTAFEKLADERPEWSEQAILQAIAEKLSVSVKTIQRRIRELRKAGRLAPRPRKPKELSNRMTMLNPTRPQD